MAYRQTYNTAHAGFVLGTPFTDMSYFNFRIGLQGYYFFDHFDSLLDCYLENVCLQDEEKLLLSALLCIVPEIHFNGHEEHNIHEMSRVLSYLEGIDRVISKLKIDC